MNGIKYLLDTCFILGFYNRSDEAIQTIHNHKIKYEQCAISIINRMEVFGFSALEAEDEINLQDIFSKFVCLDISTEIEQETIRLRKQHKIKLPDAIILATARVYNLQLVTFDKKLQKYYQDCNAL